MQSVEFSERFRAIAQEFEPDEARRYAQVEMNGFEPKSKKRKLSKLYTTDGREMTVFLTDKELRVRSAGSGSPRQGIRPKNIENAALPSFNSEAYLEVLEAISDDESWVTPEEIASRIPPASAFHVERHFLGLMAVGLIVRKVDKFRLATEHDRSFKVGTMVVSSPFSQRRRFGIVTAINPHPIHPINVLTVAWCNGEGLKESFLGSDIALPVDSLIEKSRARFLFGFNSTVSDAKIFAKAQDIRDRLRKQTHKLTSREKLWTALTYRKMTLGKCAELVGALESERLLKEWMQAGKIRLEGFPRRVVLI